MGLCKKKRNGKHFSSGIDIHGSFFFPGLSNGLVGGKNWMGSWKDSSGGNYSYTGTDGVSLDIGIAIQSVWAYGSGSWEGDFDSIVVNVGIFTFSYFSSPDGSWHGFTAGFGGGVPAGLGWERTTYKSDGGNLK